MRAHFSSIFSNSCLETDDGDKWVEAFYQGPNPPAILWPQTLRWEEVTIEPEPVASFFNGKSFSFNKGILLKTSFRYGESLISSLDSRAFSVDAPLKRILKRNLERERECLARLNSLKLDLPPARLQTTFSHRIDTRAFVAMAKEILSWGWSVEAEGKRIQRAESFDIGVGSGIDWFDLKGRATYANGGTVELPVLLSALKRGENMVVLDDGSLGIVPEEWISKYAPLTTFGSEQNGAIRFSKSQAILLDSWLDTDSEVKYDKAFLRLKKRLKACALSSSEEPPRSFDGELRPYQKEGLGWLGFLKD